ncbi:glucoamylase, glycoside hydrolase family 15 protein [Rhodotorula toruloides]|uniref:glucan 1,4-alpha-glucosidase n=1 Tax=Rhodotorula toruloides TaxID=5286 RepID=A0A511KKZ9_RHOTO|nr:glucoamylase, glycoside hydrolase family 15 protein [Rhodotorula toruloides]
MGVLSGIIRFLRIGPPPVRPKHPLQSQQQPHTTSTSQDTRPAARKSPHNPLIDLALDDFLAFERDVAWKRLLGNVNPEGTSQGCVVASPSKALPDYWYEWTRDSAVVERTIVHRFIRERRAEDWTRLTEYIVASRIMQHKQTVLGGFEDGGLGEVKYHVDHEPFTGKWGRPQADGPGSRIVTLATLAIHLVEQGKAEEVEFVKRALYPGRPEEGIDWTGVIKGDLEYVATHWKNKGFDLWEEVSGRHFYTLLTLRTSLLLGAHLATLLSDSSSAARYTAAADSIAPYLARFWDAERGVIVVTVDHAKELGAVGAYAGTADGADAGKQVKKESHANEEEAEAGANDYDETHGKVSGLDTAAVLAVLHAGRGTSWARLSTPGCVDPSTVFESGEKVLATLAQIVEAFRRLYPLNEGRRKGEAVALGRYPEDKYDGVGLSIAHPWYLCTAAAAEFLYLLVEDLAALSTSTTSSSAAFLHISPLLHSSLTSLIPSLASRLPAPGSSLPCSHPSFPLLIRSLFTLAESFLSIIQTYVGLSGSLSEQFERTGVPRRSEWHQNGQLEDSKRDPQTGEEVEAIGRGARDLTWSYAAFVTAVEERDVARRAVDGVLGAGFEREEAALKVKGRE